MICLPLRVEGNKPRRISWPLRSYKVFNYIFNNFYHKPPIWSSEIASRFCEEIWMQNPAELLLIRTKAIAYKDVGKGR